MSHRLPLSAARGPRPRLLAVAFLLVLSLALAAVLALQAIRTSQRHRATAERALEDYAGFAAFILTSHAYRQLGSAVVSTFAGWAPGARHVTPPAGTACAGGTTFFDQSGGRLRLSGAPADSAVRRFLADTLGHAGELLAEAGWRFRWVRAKAGRADGYFFASYRTPSGTGALHGFSACLGGEDSPVRKVVLTEAALPPALMGKLPADSLFSVTVVSGADQALYASPVRYDSPYVGAARFGAEFGDLTLRLALRADVADRLVIGGVPSSPTPLAAGLLSLSTLLVVMALLQLRREYELITLRSDFVSNVSHEVRTPLSQILIFTELLRLGRLRSEGERERSLDIIDQEVRRLIRLVENVLQFSRAGTRPRRVPCAALSVDRVVRETLDAFRPLAAAKDVSLRAEVAEGIEARGNRSALRQVLINLLDNAVKFGPSGQTVSVSAHVENARVRLRVDDQGPGIPLDERERVWQGYYRLPREAASAVAGTGIGLAVVQSLVTEMDGRVWVTETETGGARFVIELPASGGADS